jgi:hypothetical protein
MAAIPPWLSSNALKVSAETAPTAAAEEKRSAESAAAAAGLLGLSCAISADGEVHPYPRQMEAKVSVRGKFLLHMHMLRGADTHWAFFSFAFDKSKQMRVAALCFLLSSPHLKGGKSTGKGCI